MEFGHDEREPAHYLTTATNERTNHVDQAGTIEDLGTIETLPKRAISAPPGRGRQHNPFDDKIVETFKTGRPRVAVADDLESCKVLIRRAAAHAGLGVDIVPTVIPDGRDAVAYLGRVKRAKKAATPAPSASAVPTEPVDESNDVESFDEDPDEG